MTKLIQKTAKFDLINPKAKKKQKDLSNDFETDDY